MIEEEEESDKHQHAAGPDPWAQKGRCGGWTWWWRIMDLPAGSWGRSAQDHDIGGDVLDAGFSPNGSALTTTSGDGQVKFLIVNFHV